MDWYDCKIDGLEHYQFNWNGEVMNKKSGKFLTCLLLDTGRMATNLTFSKKYNHKQKRFSPFQIRQYISKEYFNKEWKWEDESMTNKHIRFS